MLTLAAAACGIFLLLVLAQLTGHGGAIVEPLETGWRLMLLQSLATGVGYAFFFRLQQVGGPVYLSQISYVNTGGRRRLRGAPFRRAADDLDLARGRPRLRRRRARQPDLRSRPRAVSPAPPNQTLIDRRKFDQYRHLEYAIHYVDRNWAGHGDDFARGMGS